MFKHNLTACGLLSFQNRGCKLHTWVIGGVLNIWPPSNCVTTQEGFSSLQVAHQVGQAWCPLSSRSTKQYLLSCLNLPNKKYIFLLFCQNFPSLSSCSQYVLILIRCVSMTMETQLRVLKGWDKKFAHVRHARVDCDL